MGAGGAGGAYGSRGPFLEASPPHSPASLFVGGKQCKFFLQGHCRMGNKCKFAHQPAVFAGTGGGGGGGMAPQQQQMPLAPHLMGYGAFGGGGGGGSSSSSSGPSYGPGRLDAELAMPFAGAHGRGGGHRGAFHRGFHDHHHHQPPQLPLPPPQQQHHHHAGPGSTGGGAAANSAHAHGPSPTSGAAPGPEAVLKMEDIQGRVFAMSKDQNGCRLLQEQLDFSDERKELCDVIYGEAIEHLAEMMVDPFGNYLFQKLLERARPLQRLEIIRRVSGNLVAAALNLHGTRSVQKVVEVCAASAEVVELDSDGHERRRVNLPDLLVEALKDDAVRLCIDSNGNHVIQRALQCMKPECNQFVFDAVCLECTTVGTHRHGCCVLQRCLDAANATQKREVITQVEKQAMKLMQDPYGNYVVQYVLDSCTAEEAYGVIVKPLGSVFELSVQKFSSNVIEKCLEKAPPAVLAEYIDELTACPKMQKMLQDQFANYVVQRALCVATEEQCLGLVGAIRPHLAAMKNTSGGRRITARILKRFPHMDLHLDMGFDAPPPTTISGGGMYAQPPPPPPAPAPHAPHHHHHQQQQQQQQHHPSYTSMLMRSHSSGGTGGAFGPSSTVGSPSGASMAFASPGGLGLGLHGSSMAMMNSMSGAGHL